MEESARTERSHLISGQHNFIYMPAIHVSMMAAGIDQFLAPQPSVVRGAVTSVVTGFVTTAFTSWLWGFLAGSFPLVMTIFDGAIPAVVCSLATRFGTERV